MSSATTMMLVASAAVSAVGALKQGADAKAAGEYNAAVGRNNAVAARKHAAASALRQKRVASKRMGTLRSIDPDKMDLLEDSALEEALAVADIVHGGELKAAGLETTARLDQMRGENAMSSGVMSAASGVLMAGAVSGGDFDFSSTPTGNDAGLALQFQRTAVT